MSLRLEGLNVGLSTSLVISGDFFLLLKEIVITKGAKIKIKIKFSLIKTKIF